MNPEGARGRAVSRQSRPPINDRPAVLGPMGSRVFGTSGNQQGALLTDQQTHSPRDGILGLCSMAQPRKRLVSCGRENSGG